MPDNDIFKISREFFKNSSDLEMKEFVAKWIKEIRPKFLRHPHGFWVGLIFRNDDEDWRLHIWQRGARELTGIPAKIHTHDRIVESRVLLGKIKNIVYDVKEEDIGDYVIYEVNYVGDKYHNGGRNILMSTGRTAAKRIKFEECVDAGASYSIEAHAYHEAVVSEENVTITVVCMHSKSRGSVKVLAPKNNPKEFYFSRVEADCENLLTEINLISDVS